MRAPLILTFIIQVCQLFLAIFTSFAVKILKRKERKENHAKYAKVEAKTAMISNKNKSSRKKKSNTRRRSKKSVPQADVKHTAWDALGMEEVNPLFHRHFVFGEHMMMARLKLKKGCLVPLHHHHNEQVSYVVDGALKFTFPEKEIVVNSGEVVVIPPNVPHKVEALVDTLDFDMFSPPRTDWINKNDQYLREGKETKSPRKVG